MFNTAKIVNESKSQPECKQPLVLSEVIKVFDPTKEGSKNTKEIEGSIIAETLQRLTIAVKSTNT